MRVLLVEPQFPFSAKSKNQATIVHKNFVPIGLLKIASWRKAQNDHVSLVRGNIAKEEIGLIPDNIYITTLFTYWSSFVWDSVAHYRGLYPKAKIILGGIYATLHQNESSFLALKDAWDVEVHSGLQTDAERFLPDYSLIADSGYHATHMMRGCIRKCSFCGTWKIEPKLIYKSKDEIVKEIIAVGKPKVIFYDNNLLANPHIQDILDAFVNLRVNGRLVEFESQSGFDGRLFRNQKIADLLKEARFKNPRIAWDGAFEDYSKIEEQVKMLLDAGYKRRDVFIFMIYNFDFDLEHMEKKRLMCWKWKIQIADCRYRPLAQTSDHFSARKDQTNLDYYIHEPHWSDKTVKLFRKNVRRQNICVRHGFPFYSRMLENLELSKTRSMELRTASKAYIRGLVPDVWFPDQSVANE